MPGRLTTHVLDTAHGKPAAGMKIDLCKIERAGTATLKTVATNAEGRTDEPLLEGDDLLVGVYELVFHVGEYFAHLGGDTVRPRFLDLVPVRFGISDHNSTYHIPLLVSRFSYSTYRGS
jgi:5-hydroxyisourate hydrolase